MITESQRFTASARFGTLTFMGLNFSIGLNMAASNEWLTVLICLAALIIGWLAIAANQPPRPNPTQEEPRPDIPNSNELEKRLQIAIAACVLSIVSGGAIAWIL